MSETIDKDFDSCVAAKVEAGMKREEAEQACRAAEKAKQSKDPKQFSETIEEAVAKALEGWKEQIINEAMKAVEDVKNELKETTINSVVKAIKPDQPKYVTLDNLADAMRKIQLQGLKKTDVGQSELEPIAQPSAEGYGEPGQVGGNQARKRVSDDMDKLINQFAGSAYAPKAR